MEGNSHYFADDANSLSVDGFTLACITVGLRRPVVLGAGLAVGGSVAIQNLFDRRYVASAYLNPEVVDREPVAFEPGLPRRLAIVLQVSR